MFTSVKIIIIISIIISAQNVIQTELVLGFCSFTILTMVTLVTFNCNMYLIKIMIHLLVCTLCCVYCVLKSEFTVCNKFARCHPNLIIFADMPEEFCNEVLTSLSSPNLALHVAIVPCKASNNLRACQTQSLSKVKPGF